MRPSSGRFGAVAYAEVCYNAEGDRLRTPSSLTREWEATVPRFRILPRDDKFFDWFEKGSANLLMAAKALRDLVYNYHDPGSKMALITELEHKGDFIIHEILHELNTTFVTPLDREDIHALASAIDDVVDVIEAAADSMLLYKISEPTPETRTLADLIVRCAEELDLVMPTLRDRKQLKKAMGHCIEINSLENEADRVYRRALAQLIEHPDELFELIRWTKIYDLLEQATDACEDAADVLQAVVMKHV